MTSDLFQLALKLFSVGAQISKLFVNETIDSG